MPPAVSIPSSALAVGLHGKMYSVFLCTAHYLFPFVHSDSISEINESTTFSLGYFHKPTGSASGHTPGPAALSEAAGTVGSGAGCSGPAAATSEANF